MVFADGGFGRSWGIPGYKGIEEWKKALR